VDVQITHFSIKKKTKKYFEVKPAGSHLRSARQDLSLGADSAIIFFLLQHGASGPHHERAVEFLGAPVKYFLCNAIKKCRRSCQCHCDCWHCTGAGDVLVLC
jgi:hypothetical protein